MNEGFKQSCHPVLRGTRAQPVNLEEKRKKYDLVHSGICKHWTFTSRNSLGKPAQYRRSSIAWMWWVSWKDAWSDDKPISKVGRCFWPKCCAVSRLFAISLADDMMNVERDPACVSASRRRRDRRLRSFWCLECMAVKMALATAAHHSSHRVSSASTQTEYVAPATVTE